MALSRNYLCLHNGCAKASSRGVGSGEGAWEKPFGRSPGPYWCMQSSGENRGWASRDLCLFVLSLHIWKCSISSVDSSFWGSMDDPQGLGLGGYEPGSSHLEPGAHLGGLSGNLLIHPGGCCSRPLPPICLHTPSSGEPQCSLCTTEERLGRGGCLSWGQSHPGYPLSTGVPGPRGAPSVLQLGSGC